MRKAKLTITINSDLSSEIDEIAKGKGTPRSQLMEEILRDYLSLTEEEKKENEEWAEVAAESAKRTWND